MPGYARDPQYYAQGLAFNASGNLSATNVQAAIQEVDTEKAPIETGVRIYATTAARTSAIPSPVAGMTTYITATSTLEYYNGSAWITAGGATGATGDRIFYENGITVNNSYTISSNTNAMTAGPVSVATGITVTVPTGSVWIVV